MHAFAGGLAYKDRRKTGRLDVMLFAVGIRLLYIYIRVGSDVLVAIDAVDISTNTSCYDTFPRMKIK